MGKKILEFYNGLGIDGLSNILDDNSNQAYYNFILSKIKPGNILDAGCGYGRIAIPLHQNGFEVFGVDIMQNFVDHVNKETNTNHFKLGNILNLPYENESFDNLICLWSTFSHFIAFDDQQKGLLEIHRVLKKGGQAIIDIPTPEVYKTPSFQKILTKIPSNNICEYTINGNINSDYVHDEETLEALIKTTEINEYSIKRENIGTLPRLIISFIK